MWIRRAKRAALQQLVNELFTWNERDQCWDPMGSISGEGMYKAVEVIARGKLKSEFATEARAKFRSMKKLVDGSSSTGGRTKL